MAEPRKYRPASFLRMYVRLEDFTNTPPDGLQTERKPYSPRVKKAESELTALQTQLSEMNAATAVGGSKDESSAYNLRLQISRKKRAIASLKSNRTDGGASDQPPVPATYVEFRTVPISAKFEANGFRTADTLTATFPFRDAPLDSRIIRECMVEFFEGTVTVENFSTRDNWVLPSSMSDTTVCSFRGYVDEWKSPHDEGGSFITFQARSMEAVLIDGKINPRAPNYRIKGKSEKITAYVNRILEQYPPTSGKFGSELRAHWYMADPAAEPSLNAKDLTRALQTAASRAAAAGAATGQEAPVQAQQPGDEANPAQAQGQYSGEASIPSKVQKVEGESIWDLITTACELAGCMPIYDPSLPIIRVGEEPSPGQEDTRAIIDPKNSILLRPPQTIYEDVNRGLSIKGGAQDGFSRWLMNDKTPVKSDIRMMVWGENIKKLEFTRKMSRAKAVGVEVRSYNPDAPPAERILVARYPAKPTVTHMKMHGPKGKNSSAPIEVIKTILVRGIRSKYMLEQIACSIFNQISRQELTVNVETDDLASYIDLRSPVQAGFKAENHNSNPDLLKLRPGTPVRILVAREVQDPSAGNSIVISTLSEVMDKRGDRIKDLLLAQNARFRNWQSVANVEEVAAKVQAALSSAKLPDVFYCKNLSREHGPDGVQMNIELCNYLEARLDASKLDSESQRIANATKLKGKKLATLDEKAKKAADDADRRMLAELAKLDDKQGREAFAAAQKMIGGGT